MSRVNSFSIFATIFASITIICVIGAVIVSTRRGKPAESEKPPSNLQQPQENSVSRIEGRLNHTISADGTFIVPIGLPYEINCTLFVNTEKPRQKDDEISLTSLTKHMTLDYKKCILKPLNVEERMWWCNSTFQMAKVDKVGTERLACCSSNWDKDCRRGYSFTIHFKENVTTTKQLSETSTTVNTLAHSQVTTKLSSTESQPKKPNSLTTKQTPLMIAFEIIGSATACVSCLLCCRRKLRSRRKKRASGNSYELAST